MTGKVNVEFELSLNWEKGAVSHRERFYVRRANLWRDLWREGLDAFLGGASPGDRTSLHLPPGRAVPPYDENSVVAVRSSDLRLTGGLCGEGLRAGRFYPRGILAPAAGLFRDDLRPFRVTGRDGAWIIADLNHPLATHRLEVEATLIARRGKHAELGGSCIDWLEETAADGPGMQERWQGLKTDFSHPRAFARKDENDDMLFYGEERLVGHVDSLADGHLAAEYGRHLPRNAALLDLMSSYQSHLPAGLGATVTGLGLNEEEMRRNSFLADHVVHDLNADPSLPFGAGAFGAVVCSLSYEYLTRPRRVLAEAARVLVDGGVLVIGLSNRWFPPKVVRLWAELHPFERLGLVVEDLRSTGLFDVLETATLRNWPRPSTDRHYPRETTSDPLYILAAVKKGPSPS